MDFNQRESWSGGLMIGVYWIFGLSGERLFEVGAYPKVGAYPNKYGKNKMNSGSCSKMTPIGKNGQTHPYGSCKITFWLWLSLFVFQRILKCDFKGHQDSVVAIPLNWYEKRKVM